MLVVKLWSFPEGKGFLHSTPAWGAVEYVALDRNDTAVQNDFGRHIAELLPVIRDILLGLVGDRSTTIVCY